MEHSQYSSDGNGSESPGRQEFLVPLNDAPGLGGDDIDSPVSVHDVINWKNPGRPQHQGNVNDEEMDNDFEGDAPRVVDRVEAVELCKSFLTIKTKGGKNWEYAVDLIAGHKPLTAEDLQRLKGIKAWKEQIAELERIVGHVSQAASRRSSVASRGRRSNKGGSPDDSEDGTSTVAKGKRPVHKSLRDPEEWDKERNALFDGEQTSLSTNETFDLFNAAAASHFGKDVLVRQEKLAAYNRELHLREQALPINRSIGANIGMLAFVAFDGLPASSKRSKTFEAMREWLQVRAEGGRDALTMEAHAPAAPMVRPTGSRQSPESTVPSKPKKARHSMPPPPRPRPGQPLPHRPNSAAGSSTRP